MCAAASGSPRSGEPTGWRRWSSATAPNSTRTSSSWASDRGPPPNGWTAAASRSTTALSATTAAAPARRTCGRSVTSRPGATPRDTKCAWSIGATSPTRPEASCAAMLGNDLPATVTVPYFWSDQYDVKIQCLGEPEADDIVARRRGRRPKVPRVLRARRRGGRRGRRRHARQGHEGPQQDCRGRTDRRRPRLALITALGRSISATRNANSRDWPMFSRGSQTVS